ncbi:hypothetical protein OOU_Y34scaffold00768g6 [Pyricularia oryzae Y34]|uniref:Uncharacterized protein n=2 Tax=Pyricularia oryzae TaxID=318829 RepID=A0AA97NQD9_PYRO3|nr:hypothetical protein OOU_Y34scaffold00768g6 [Pyricularia oryzae Y34]
MDSKSSRDRLSSSGRDNPVLSPNPFNGTSIAAYTLSRIAHLV